MTERTFIHVNQHVIRANRAKLVADDIAMAMVDADMPASVPLSPPLTVKGRTNRKAFEAIIRFRGEEVGRFVYRPQNPLACGAHVWFETPTDEDIDIEVI